MDDRLSLTAQTLALRNSLLGRGKCLQCLWVQWQAGLRGALVGAAVGPAVRCQAPAAGPAQRGGALPRGGAPAGRGGGGQPGPVARAVARPSWAGG